MQRHTLSMAALVLGATMAWGQALPQTKPPDTRIYLGEFLVLELRKASLESLLAKAIKENPDIKVAESKLRESEAELNRARLLVIQKVVKLYHDIASARATVEEAQFRGERARKLALTGGLSGEEAATALLSVQLAKANLAKLEAELPYLLGKQPEGILRYSILDAKLHVVDVERTMGARFALDLIEQPKGTMADNLRKALDTPVKVDFNDTNPQEILEYFKDKMKGVNIHVPLKLPAAKSMKLNDPVPLGAALQCFEDTFGLRLLVRDYGLVVTLPDRAPPGALTLQEFWKNPPKKAPSPPSEKGTLP